MEPTAQGGSERPVPENRPARGSEISAGRHPEQPASVGFLLSQLGFATSAGFHGALAPLGIDPAHFATLRALAANEGQSQQAICAALHIPPSRMVGLVDELEGRGLVERRINASDRRARAVHLTDEGRQLLDRALAAAVEYETWLSAPLGAEERRRLLQALSRLAEHFGLHRDVHPGLTSARPPGWGVGTPSRGRPTGEGRSGGSP